jgi:hypothetical protein
MSKEGIEDNLVISGSSSSSLTSSNINPLNRQNLRRPVFNMIVHGGNVQERFKFLDLEMNIPNKKNLKIMED